MPEVGLTARFPLGVFQGRLADGSTRDPFPDVSRLHGALMQAAGKGVTAVERDGDLRPSERSLKALRWLDEHPPDGVELPARMPTNSEQRELVSYRVEGVLEKKGATLVDRKSRSNLNNRIAVANRIGWLWRHMPDDVAGVMEALCADVSCLGEADSPVVVELAPVAPTHWRAERASQLGRAHGLRVGCPESGTTDQLEQGYDAEHPVRRPTLSADRYSPSRLPSPSAVVRRKRIVVYQAPAEEPPASPWSRALILACEVAFPSPTRIAWSVALHRLITARIGDAAPSSITGNYQVGQPRPANHVAIHALDASLAHNAGCATSAMVILVPRDMTSQDLARLTAAVVGEPRLRSSLGETRLRLVKEIAADEFWQPPRPGTTRFWSPEPAMVSETRRQHDDQGERWTLSHAALLSLGFVFKDSLPQTSGKRGYWSLFREVGARGARAHNVRPVADSHVERYAYKYPKGAIVQPFSALFDLGQLADERTVLAVGQARHMGGGLLTPVDVEQPVVEELRHEPHSH